MTVPFHHESVIFPLFSLDSYTQILLHSPPLLSAAERVYLEPTSPPPHPPIVDGVLLLHRSARCMVIVLALGQARVLLHDPADSPNTISFHVLLTLSWPTVRKLLRIGVRSVWGNGQGLILVAAYLNNLVKNKMHGDGSRRGLIYNLFVSRPHAKVGKPSTEVCMHPTASLPVMQQ